MDSQGSTDGIFVPEVSLPLTSPLAPSMILFPETASYWTSNQHVEEGRNFAKTTTPANRNRLWTF